MLNSIWNLTSEFIIILTVTWKQSMILQCKFFCGRVVLMFWLMFLQNDFLMIVCERFYNNRYFWPPQASMFFCFFSVALSIYFPFIWNVFLKSFYWFFFSCYCILYVKYSDELFVFCAAPSGQNVPITLERQTGSAFRVDYTPVEVGKFIQLFTFIFVALHIINRDYFFIWISWK